MCKLQTVLEAKHHEESRDARAKSSPVSRGILSADLGWTGFALGWDYNALVNPGALEATGLGRVYTSY